MSSLRLIGDVHGQYKKYIGITKDCEYSLQVGDMGFNYSALESIDSDRHKFFGGNHDNYDIIDKSACCLGDFGVWEIPTIGSIFWVRGGWSIDRQFRTPMMDWWPTEQLSLPQCDEAYALYEQVRPSVLVSHECPLNIVQYVTNPLVAHSFNCDSVVTTNTNSLLQRMTDVHRPNIHIFGHYHLGFDSIIDGTRYICLDILNHIDLSKHHFESNK